MRFWALAAVGLGKSLDHRLGRGVERRFLASEQGNDLGLGVGDSLRQEWSHERREAVGRQRQKAG